MIKCSVPKTFNATFDSKLKNLLISGCSFSRNNISSDELQQHALSWPVYLRDKLNFDMLYDCSLPGSGNFHICNSIIWTLETQSFSPKDTFIAVMWSGNDRDDLIIDSQYLNNYYSNFKYNNNVATAISGGDIENSFPNVDSFQVKHLKSLESRAIENYLYITSLYHYLKSQNYKFIMLDYMGKREIPALSNDFSIFKYLPINCQHQLKKMICYDIEDIYSWSFRNNMLSDDYFHPSHNGHLTWTDNVLVPFLANNWNTF